MNNPRTTPAKLEVGHPHKVMRASPFRREVYGRGNSAGNYVRRSIPIKVTIHAIAISDIVKYAPSFSRRRFDAKSAVEIFSWRLRDLIIS